MSPDSEPSTPIDDRPSSDLPPLRRGGRVGTLLVVALAFGVVAVVAVTALGRTIRAPGYPLLVAVTLLPALYATLGALVFSVWCVLPDRRTLPTLLAALTLVAGVLWGPSFPARPETADGLPLTVVSWNVQRFWGGEEGGDALQCVVDGVAAERADVVVLLEISRDALSEVSASLGVDCVHVDYFGTGDASRGGLAVCARRDSFVIEGRGQRFTDDESWRYVFAEVSGQGRRFNVLGVHLQPFWPLTGAVMRQSVSDLAQGEAGPILEVSRDSTAVVTRQGAQSAALLERVSGFVDPTLVAGDFNSTRDSSLHTELRGSFVDTFARGGVGFGSTVHALGWLPLRVDYIYATPDFAVAQSALGPASCSDHRPVVSHLILRDDER